MKKDINTKTKMCERCSKLFFHASEVKQQMLTHYEPTFKCEKCQKMFNLKSELNRYSKACGSRVQCTMCPKMFTNFKYLHDHMSSKHASPSD